MLTADRRRHPPDKRPEEPTWPEHGPGPSATRAELVRYHRHVHDRLSELLRVVAKVATRDFSEKPRMAESPDPVSRFAVGFRFMVEDLERAQAEVAREREELKAVAGQLQELNRMKTRFINSAAHELGTPMTPIKLQLHLLRSHPSATPDERARALEIMDRNVERLRLLVSDMLDVARLESGRLRLVLEPIRMDEAIKDAAESFAAVAQMAGLRLEVDARTPLRVEADPKRVTQILYNLIDNAIKYTPRGGRIRLVVKARSDEVLVQVEDNGIGIDASDFPKLFQPFSQIHDEPDVVRPGTGLGLNITKGLLEQMGGHIWCDSPGRGLGSTFSFVLRAAAAPTAPAQAGRGATSRVGPQAF